MLPFEFKMAGAMFLVLVIVIGIHEGFFGPYAKLILGLR